MTTKRINVSLDAGLHSAAVKRAKDEIINGGFSGYLAQLIKDDLKKAKAGQPAADTEIPVNLMGAVEAAERRLAGHANTSRKR